MQKSAPLFNSLSEHITHNKEVPCSVGRSHHFFDDQASISLSSPSLVCCSLKLDIQSQFRKDINSKKPCEK